MTGQAVAKTTAKATIRGVAHEFVVPDDWASRPGDDGIEFIPPAAKVHGPMTVAIVGVEKQKTSDPVSIARTLADNDHKKKPYLSWQDPQKVEFVGSTGAMLLLSGQGPTGETEGEVLVVSVADDTIYLFNCEGRLDDITSLVDDLGVIISGATVAGKGPAGGGGGGLGSGGIGGLGLDGSELQRRISGQFGSGGGSSVGGGAATGPTLVSDPAFGLSVRGLERWKVSVADDEYQFERTDSDPIASLSVKRVPMTDRRRYERDVSAGSRAHSGKFAGQEALIVERRAGDTIEREYHVFRKNHALVVGFRVIGRTGMEAVDARIAEFEQAADVREGTGVDSWDDGRTDVETYGGVRLSTTASWKLLKLGPGTANFRGPRGVELEVRARPWPMTGDPYVDQGDGLKGRCTSGTYSKAETAVLGADSAIRYRCAGKTGSELILVADGRATGQRVFVVVTAHLPGKKGAPPDSELAEFSTYVSLPHAARR